MLLYSIFRWFSVAAILSALLVQTSCRNSAAEKRDNNTGAVPAPRVQVHVVPVQVKQIHRNVESVGSLFPLEEVTVSSEVEGKVDQVLVDVGDRVENGQALVQVSTVELKLAVDQQRALYQQARARLGLREESDDLKNVLDAAEVKKAAADLKDVEDVYKRSQQLFA